MLLQALRRGGHGGGHGRSWLLEAKVGAAELERVPLSVLGGGHGGPEREAGVGDDGIWGGGKRRVEGRAPWEGEGEVLGRLVFCMLS